MKILLLLLWLLISIANTPCRAQDSIQLQVPLVFVVIHDPAHQTPNFSPRQARRFFIHLVQAMNEALSHLDTRADQDSCRYNTTLPPAPDLTASSHLPIRFQLKAIRHITHPQLWDASRYFSCGEALQATYQPAILHRLARDTPAVFVFVPTSRCWHLLLNADTAPTYCSARYEATGRHVMCAQFPGRQPRIHIMAGALYLHQQHHHPPIDRQARSMLHEIFHWMGLGHVYHCPVALMNPSGQATRTFLNASEQRHLLQAPARYPIWRFVQSGRGDKWR